MLKYGKRDIGNVTIIDYREGNLNIEGQSTIRESLAGETNNRTPNLILNLANVAQIDSTGIGELVAALGVIKSKGGSIKLLNPNKSVFHKLNITKLNTYFPIYNDEAAAIASFGPSRSTPPAPPPSFTTAHL